ncbi:unnamed protein product [Paramecium sonneborni]|uniref:Uncharacterized protein n=1 Tax=Paramecium sonneborni TaxID=65129 RepID=A0A8S1Q1X5_9CILI|nr:unnamed protein product [Paramecium sonneborni]
MKLKIPQVLRFQTETKSQQSNSIKDLDISKNHDQTQQQNQKSHQIVNHYFQPKLKVITSLKPQLLVNQIPIHQNKSFRELSFAESSGSPKSKREEKFDEVCSSFRGRIQSIKQQMSPYLINQQSPPSMRNLESQKKIQENTFQYNRHQVNKQKEIDYSPSYQLAQNEYMNNFQQTKSPRHLVPFQIEKSVKDIERSIKRQNEKYLSPISAEKNVVCPQIKQFDKGQEFKEKNYNKLKQRKKSIHLPQSYEDVINRKVKNFQKSTFQNQCIHLIYIRPSAIRIQKYLLKDVKNEELLRKCFSYRWWWQESTNQGEDVEFFWYSQASISFLNKQEQRHISDKKQFQPFEQIVKKAQGVEDQMKFAIENKLSLLSPIIKVHNHIDLSYPLWTKKNLIGQIIKYCQLTRQYVENFIPLSMVVDYLGENLLSEFLKNLNTSTSVWVVRKSDFKEDDKIMICQNTQSVFNHLSKEFKMSNRNQQSFIVQQFISSFAYQEIQLDLCYYLLITQINGIVRGYFFQQFYGQQSKIQFSNFDNESRIIQIENSKQEIQNQYIPMKNIQNHFKKHNIDYKNKIYPQIKHILCEYLKSIFIQMPVKDHNFELLKVVIIIDNESKPWLINTESNPVFETDLEFMKDYSQLLLDNVLQLGLDILFPSPSIWPKEKKRDIEIYQEINYFDLVFDSRIEGKGLKSLFEQNYNKDNYCDDEY